mmetsp:Transcript_2386/g.9218  ORF Transcript_2386/g.9218 Transcript_2386/m.9218 type:complete len:143 (-) Transcript_2386:1020-1448(-)
MGSASSTPSWEIKNRCTRCLGDCDYGTCLVPHPIMERDMTSMMGSRHGCTEQFHCRACDGSFNLTTGKNGRVTHDAGPKWCFEGPHSAERVAPGDKRRVLPKTVHLVDKKSLQLQRHCVSRHHRGRRVVQRQRVVPVPNEAP